MCEGRVTHLQLSFNRHQGTYLQYGTYYACTSNI
ncbi:predicted protein [Plenodomus lingam JN3]|uniref:Predicted protein n=1 Tax=Leptosphaeria maculans (strain JN3 / isolate v23.1.3 / race Av1-4-5-6-7-8) TaxID=985895 RepID=E4ZMU0_LEPMJ|nr:predicted protein [Plenodomus lingam JN3]CBX92543.1 predicted protein [Plenodomus lingam JN3]